MNSIIHFTVPGQPQGKARARTGYNPKVKRVTSHTPENTVLYENLIKTCYLQNTIGMFNDDESLELRINAFFEPAKSTSKKKKDQMLAGVIYPTKKPDIDNIAKAVLDALNGIAYHDDRQVIRLAVAKCYSQQARLEIEVRKIEK